LPIMRVLLEKGYPEDAIGDIKTQGQAERIIELWPKAEKPLPPLMGTRRIEALEERGIEPTLPEIKKGYGMYIEPPEEEKEVPLFSTITGATQMYPESEANRLKMTAPKIYRTFEERTKLPEITGAYKIGQIKDFKEGDKFITKKYLGEGQWEKIGEAPRYKPTTKVDITVDTGLSKKVQSDLQGEIFEMENNLYSLNQAGELFQDDFLKYAGKGIGWLADKTDKLGIPWKQDYLEKYSTWQGIVDMQTLAYRKMVTGVAGGEKEMKAIEKTYINTKYDGPTKFKAKLEIYKHNTKAAIERKKAALATFGKKWPQLNLNERKQLAELYPFAFTEKDIEKTTVIPKEQFIKGKFYQDAQGRTAEYLGDGKWRLK